ncbi:MAG: micrococcal nuclease [Actinomycetota bacterium]|jgi:micrococcal nuclease|nr:micrococcal nuclease [Actinomycetota bacterium]
MRRLVIACLLVAACAAPAATPGTVPDDTALTVPAGAQEAVVVRHTDGDTLWLRGIGVGPLPGRSTKVRVLEIDTPEVFGTPGCYGTQASARTAQLVPLGAHVRVEADRDARDRYGRLLLYVWTASGASLEEVLLREGYARTLLVRPNDSHIDAFRAVEAAARKAKRGLWSACPAT